MKIWVVVFGVLALSSVAGSQDDNWIRRTECEYERKPSPVALAVFRYEFTEYEQWTNASCIVLLRNDEEAVTLTYASDVSFRKPRTISRCIVYLPDDKIVFTLKRHGFQMEDSEGVATGNCMTYSRKSSL